ncbi:AEC family transporter [Photobacterium sp. DNB23_23_1]|uniref:AEC family transporter n=1 Tax=Photobacterium pectinilyticum TaxID=2906793 RepID=A0ABT1NB21_9GAMM|nr:AEC family transporter [Photobacterium sp. ZSDE20]MCQ1061317.1 AEC family transporter [Photobacterium sp. ZSDE20]MDD1826913.1 AEC family transporter [Photobacterium sp. ZSDE20]
MLFELLFPLLSIMATGALLDNKTDLFDTPVIPNLVTTVGIPCMMLHAVLQMNMSFATMGQLVIATLVYLVAMAIIGAAVLYFSRQPIRQYLPAIVNPNTGNIGVPVCIALLGPQAAAPALVISSVVQISHFTLGVGCYSGSMSPQALLRNMPVMALVFGALLTLAEIELNPSVMQSLDMVGSITVPLMLMQLGCTVSRLKFYNLCKAYKPAMLAVMRVLLGAMVAVVVIQYSPVSTLDAKVFVIQGAMPIAIISYVLSCRYQSDSDDIALAILFSIPLAIITALTFSQHIF